jgi:2,5-diketo-D-gluconate reductase A
MLATAAAAAILLPAVVSAVPTVSVTHAAPVVPLAPFTIAPGVEMPAVNLGHPDDAGGKSKNEAASAELWLSLGGSGIDTAADYGNQAQVAIAIEAAVAKGLNHTSIFVTTKISPSDCSQAAAVAAVQADLKQLKLSTVDLVLHHFPCRDNPAGNAAIWEGLLEAKRMGLARTQPLHSVPSGCRPAAFVIPSSTNAVFWTGAVGVSNYKASDLEKLLTNGVPVPAVNQCQMSVGSHDDTTIAFCRQHNITYESYSPLRDVDLSDKRITPIATAHNVTTAQVALKWIVQQGFPVATSPDMNREYCEEDLALGGFMLSEEEMHTLSLI